MTVHENTTSVSGPWRAGAWVDADLASVAAAYTSDPVGVLGEADALARLAGALGVDTWAYLTGLATLGSIDLSVARAAEPHVDALAILAQAGRPDLAAAGVDDAATFGVFAAQAPGLRLSAQPSAGEMAGHVVLQGDKPWCSLATTLSHALVTAMAHDLDGATGKTGLYAVDLRHRGVTAVDTPWVPRGLTAIATQTLSFDAVPAVAVGDPGWYLTRPGFAWGGIGVAAVWFGAAAALVGALREAAGRREPDQIARMHLGRADVVLHGAHLALAGAAADIDGGRATGAAGELLGVRVRSVVAAAAEDILGIVGHALGPAPLTHDDTHARRVADLTVYVRQHHAERDLARLGELILRAGGDA